MLRKRDKNLKNKVKHSKIIKKGRHNRRHIVIFLVSTYLVCYVVALDLKSTF